MQAHYIVPEGREPSDEAIYALGKAEYDKLVERFSNTAYEVTDTEEEYIRDGWDTFRRRLEVKVATPAHTVVYDSETSKWGDVMAVKEWVECCEVGGFIDYDGFGKPMKEGLVACNCILHPSIRHLIPQDATHIEWYNR